jgi:glycosyltransferase involved in cell wall biosynthesis
MAERWLVISHEATNSGAPRMLLQILRGVSALRGAEWKCEILLRRGGVLEPEFARLGPVHLLPHPWAEGRSLRAGIYRKFFDRPWIQPRRLFRWIRHWEGAGFDLVYNNTATNSYLVPAARRLGCPIVTHVHELGCAMRRFNTPAALAQTLMNTDRFIAVSPSVMADLVDCGAPADRVTVVPNFLPKLPAEPDAAARAALRQQLGLPADAWVVTGCGHVDHIKGTDLFVEVAAVLKGRIRRPLCFTWIGGVTDARFARSVRRLVRRRGVSDVVRFIGAVEEPAPWFGASDVVAVTSRFESFSLVALESAALGRPVVGFAGARGLASVLGGSSLLAADHDPAAMASIVLSLLENTVYAQDVGQRLRSRVGAEFLATPRIREILSVTGELRMRWRN